MTVKIPANWTDLRKKAGASTTDSLLDLVWDPGYQGLYENFLSWTDSRIRGYLATVGELKYIPLPGVGPYMPGYEFPLTFYPSVWATAKAMKSQARQAFVGIIETALSEGASEDVLFGRVDLAWGLLDGSRRSEIETRLRKLSHTAMGWYKHFARRYFMMQAPTTIGVLAFWHAYLKPLLSASLERRHIEFAQRFPETARVVGLYVERPLNTLRRNWYGLKYIPRLISDFCADLKTVAIALKREGLGVLGVGPALKSLATKLAVGLPSAGLLSGIVAALAMIMIYGQKAGGAPTFTDEELDAIYGNPDLQPYREEVAQMAVEVHEVEQRLSTLEHTLEEEEGSLGLKPFSEQVLSDIENDIQRIRLSISDGVLNSVREELLARAHKLRGETIGAAGVGPGMTYEHMKSREGGIVSDAILEAYYDEGAILDLLAPEIERLMEDRDTDEMTDDEIAGIVQTAGERSRPLMENYAAGLAEQILKEQKEWQVAEPNTMALEAAIEAGERLENLVTLEITGQSEYETVIQQLERAAGQLDSEDLDLANEIIASTKSLLEVLPV